MPESLQTYPVEFRGGLITNLSPLQQGINAPGSARQLRNFEPSVEGGYKRILGFDKYDSTEIPGTGLVRGVFYYNGKVLAVRNNTVGGEGELYESTGSGAWTRKSTDSIRFTSGTNKVRFAKFNFDGTERVVIVDGVNTPFFYDGSSISKPTLTDAQEGANFVAVFKNHIFLAKNTSIITSAPLGYADANGWSPANNAQEQQYNDQITGLIPFRDQLFIFSKTAINKISGSTWSDFVRSPVSEDMGCTHPDTIQEIAGDIVFMAPDGLRLLSGTSRIGDIGLGTITKNIQKEITDFQSRHGIFCSALVRGKSQYRVFGYRSGDDVENARGLLGTQFASEGGGEVSWAETRGIQAYVAYGEYSENEEQIFFANADGYVYQLERGNSFDGSNIDASYYTPYFPINDPAVRKTMYVLHSYIDPEGSLRATARMSYDFGDDQIVQPDPIDLTNLLTTESEDFDTGLYGSATYATYSGATVTSGFVYGDAVRIALRKQVTGSGFVVSIEYTSSGSTQPFALDALALEYSTQTRR